MSSTLAEVSVTRVGASPAGATRQGDSLVFDDAWHGATIIDLALDDRVEELLAVTTGEASFVYDIALPRGHTLHRPAAAQGIIEVRDARGSALLRMRAEQAFDAGGRALAPLVELLDDRRVRVALPPGTALPAIIDPSWQSAGTMVMPRSGHAATLLTDGRLLITGGSAASGPAGLAEIYDPVTSTFSVSDAPNSELAAMLPGGVLFVEGSAATRYEPASGTKTSIPGVLGAISRVVPLSDGKALLVSYLAPTGANLQVLDLATASVSPTKTLPKLTSTATINALPDGTVLFAGGWQETNFLAPPQSAALLRFDPQTLATTATGALPLGLEGHTATAMADGRVLVAGGFNSTDAAVGSTKVSAMSFWVDPLTLKVTTGPVMQHRRAFHRAATTADALLMQLGGFDSMSGSLSGALTPSTEALDPTGCWRVRGSVGCCLSADQLAQCSTGTAQQYPCTNGTTCAWLGGLTGSYACHFGGDTAPPEYPAPCPSGTGPGFASLDQLPASLSDFTITAMPSGLLAAVGGCIGESCSSKGSTATSPDLSLAREAGLPGLVSEGPSFARTNHVAAALPDVRVLLAGGVDPSGAETADAWVYDPDADALAPLPAMSEPKQGHSATLLSDGRVLLVGGGPDGRTIERFDPAAGKLAVVGQLKDGRRFHTATLLPDGRVWVAGGHQGPSLRASTEIVDGNGAVTQGPPLPHARTRHAAARLLDGRVIVLGGRDDFGELAEIVAYEPAAGAVEVVANKLPGDRTAAALLPSGRVLLTSPSWGQGWLLDPATLAQTPVPFPTPTGQATPVLLPTGQVLVVGGHGVLVSEPTASDGGHALEASDMSGHLPQGGQSATLLGDGSVLIAGGDTASGPMTRLYRFRARFRSGGAAPALTSLPAGVVPGAAAPMGGAGLTGQGDGADGRPGASPSNYPVPIWMPFDGGMVMGTARDWTATGATWVPRATALRGPGRLFVAVSGVRSNARFTAVGAAPQGVACAADAACASGHCVDGVCCDTACGGPCVACTKAKKGAGVDGSCGAVAKATDPDAECDDADGTTCGKTGVCDGAGACEVAPNGKPCAPGKCVSDTLHVAPSTCDGASSCAAPLPDSCGAFRCDGATAACKQSCADASDCAPGASCLASACQFPADLGAPCGSSEQCSTGHCIDGVCCNSGCVGVCMACSAGKKGQGIDGVCEPVAAGGDPDDDCVGGTATDCLGDGACDGGGACSVKAPQTPCSPELSSCDDGQAGSVARWWGCDAVGGCTRLLQTDCGPARCDGDACATQCTKDEQCSQSGYCATPPGACKARRALGEPCGRDAECNSAHCVDAVCCTGACEESCFGCSAAAKGGGVDGACEPVADGVPDPRKVCPASISKLCAGDGTCNGGGSCRLPAYGSPCESDCLDLEDGSTCSLRSPSCEKRGAQPFFSGTTWSCNGAGRCNVAVSTPCGLFACGADDRCLATCAGDDDCLPTAHCENAVCAPRRALGSPCSASSQCQLGHCVDGVCCDAACDGPCLSCIAAGHGGADGTCVPLPGGAADQACDDEVSTGKNPCGFDGKCAEGGACRKVARDTACGPTTCTDKPGATSLVSGALCTGFGQCSTQLSSDCGLFRCGDEACRHSCVESAHCIDAAYCDGGSCVPRRAIGAPCSADEQCKSGFCASGACQSGGPSTCDEAGRLLVSSDGTKLDCAPYRCEAGHCLDRCDSDAQCVDEMTCRGATCASTCTEDGLSIVTVTRDQGRLTFACAPYRCEAGACLASCQGTRDCAPGSRCDVDGRCVAQREVAEAVDPGCAASPAPPRPPLGWLLLAALLLRRRASRAA